MRSGNEVELLAPAELELGLDVLPVGGNGFFTNSQKRAHFPAGFPLSDESKNLHLSEREDGQVDTARSGARTRAIACERREWSPIQGIKDQSSKILSIRAAGEHTSRTRCIEPWDHPCGRGRNQDNHREIGLMHTNLWEQSEGASPAGERESHNEDVGRRERLEKLSPRGGFACNAEVPTEGRRKTVEKDGVAVGKEKPMGGNLLGFPAIRFVFFRCPVHDGRIYEWTR